MKFIHVIIDGLELTVRDGQTILQAATQNGIDIPTLCNDERVKPYGACSLCVVEVEGVPKLLRACATKITDGMKIRTTSERIRRARKSALELIMSDHEGDCRGPCSLNCPAETDCQGYVKKIAEEDFHGAMKLIKERISLPASVGRICPHPCEEACRRGLVEEPISICYLKAFAADQDYASENPYMPDVAPETGKSVCVIGSGPAGLTTAYYLRQKGHAVTILEAMPKAGGMLRYGIPEYRLPKRILDREIQAITDLGIEIRYMTRVGEQVTLAELKDSYDAVVVAIGAWKDMPLRCTGNQLDGVMGGCEFLRKVAVNEAPDIGKNVMIVGGGNTAMDACRTAVRQGAEHVYVAYRRTRDEMPAEDLEIEEAIEEGVEFLFLTNPEEIIAGEDGSVAQVRLQIMELGEPDESGRRRPVPVEGSFKTIDVDSVIAALGHGLLYDGFEMLAQSEKGNIEAGLYSFRTSVDGIFAVGEATNKGATIAVETIGQADRAVEQIDAYLNGSTTYYKGAYVSERKVSEIDFKDYEKKARAVMPRRSREITRHDYLEVNLGFSKEQAVEEAKRCLECGCHDYGHCTLIKRANEYPIHPERLEGVKHPAFKEERLKVISRDQGKCLLCGLCVRICEEEAKKGILGLVGRGFDTVVRPEFRDESVIAGCKDCRLCLDACPTGALKLV